VREMEEKACFRKKRRENDYFEKESFVLLEERNIDE
jgi:hypothetical protein